MKRLLFLAVSVFLVCAWTGCAKGPEVLQGKVVQYDAATQSLVVKDERAGQREVQLSLQDSEIGAEPEVDDLVRVAYREVGGRLVVRRVMNLTRQKEVAAQRK